MTLMSIDVDRIATGLMNSHDFWASPVEIVIAWCFQVNLWDTPLRSLWLLL